MVVRCVATSWRVWTFATDEKKTDFNVENFITNIFFHLTFKDNSPAFLFYGKTDYHIRFISAKSSLNFVEVFPHLLSNWTQNFKLSHQKKLFIQMKIMDTIDYPKSEG
jgi:hypothetical protein